MAQSAGTAEYTDWVSKKRNDKELMICLKPKPSQTFFVYTVNTK